MKLTKTTAAYFWQPLICVDMSSLYNGYILHIVACDLNKWKYLLNTAFFSMQQPQVCELSGHVFFWCNMLDRSVERRDLRVCVCAFVCVQHPTQPPDRALSISSPLMQSWCHFIFLSASAVTIIHSGPLKLLAHVETVWLKRWHFTKTSAPYIHASPSLPGGVTSQCLWEQSPFRTAFKNKLHFMSWTRSYVCITTGCS